MKFQPRHMFLIHNMSNGPTDVLAQIPRLTFHVECSILFSDEFRSMLFLFFGGDDDGCQEGWLVRRGGGGVEKHRRHS